jgi:hypothetical protein
LQDLRKDAGKIKRMPKRSGGSGMSGDQKDISKRYIR